MDWTSQDDIEGECAPTQLVPASQACDIAEESALEFNPDQSQDAWEAGTSCVGAHSPSMSSWDVQSIVGAASVLLVLCLLRVRRAWGVSGSVKLLLQFARQLRFPGARAWRTVLALYVCAASERACCLLAHRACLQWLKLKTSGRSPLVPLLYARLEHGSLAA